MSWTEQNNYYVEYLNGDEFHNIFCNSSTFRKLQKCPWIVILEVKKANKKLDKWEAVAF